MNNVRGGDKRGAWQEKGAQERTLKDCKMRRRRKWAREGVQAVLFAVVTRLGDVDYSTSNVASV